MENFEDFFEESGNSSGSELSGIGDDVPLKDGSCPPAPLLESAHSSRSMGSGGGANWLPASRGSVRTSTPRRALGNAAAPSSASNEILVELKKVNTRLESFCERLDSLDGRLKSVEDMQVNLSSSVSSNTEESALKTKRKVPSRVSVSYHHTHLLLPASSFPLPPFFPFLKNTHLYTRKQLCLCMFSLTVTILHLCVVVLVLQLFS